MNKMSIGVALLAGTVTGLLSTVSAENLQARAIPSSQGCPIQIAAKMLPQFGARPLNSESKSAYILAVVLSGDRVSQIERVKLTVVRAAAGNQITPASTDSDAERLKTFDLNRTNLHDGLLEGRVSLPWANVRFVRVDSIVYGNQPVWHPTKDEYCIASPYGTQLISSLR